MANYTELLEQKAKLDAQLEQARNEERRGVIEEIRQKLCDYQITLDEIGGKRTGRKAKGIRPPVLAKYRDPQTGMEWSGRGRSPLWIRNAANRDKFLIPR